MADSDKPLTLFTSKLSSEQAEKLHALLKAEGFKFEPKPYTLYYATKPRLNIAVYEKGPKVVLQGKDTQEFDQFRLEPEILGEARVGYEEVLQPEMFEPHFGIDESGKGDFFGPLVIAGVFVDQPIARTFLEAGIQDSKRITSDARIRALSKIIKDATHNAHSVVEIPPAKYNALYDKIGNVNKLLAWGHARVIENLATMRPDCPRALSDQFANPSLIQRALMENGRKLQLDQRTKAESDLAVAAASILARERFINWFDNTGRRFEKKLPRGANAEVKRVAREIVDAHGVTILPELVKMHFKTSQEI